MRKFIWGLGVVFLFFVASFILNPVAGASKKLFNAGELYYEKNITEDQVDKLGNFLIKEKFFDGVRKTIYFDKKDDVYILKVVVKTGIEQDFRYIIMLEEFAKQLSHVVLNGARLDLHLCDEKLKTLRIIPYSN